MTELTAGLVWPTICRAAGMAAQPPRLILGILVVAAIQLLGYLFDRIRGDVGDLEQGVFEGLWDSFVGLGHMVFAPGSWDPAHVAASAGEGALRFIGTWTMLFREYPVSSIFVLLIIFLPAWTLGGGAICRMIAVDLAGHYNMSVREALGCSLQRWKTSVAAMLLPAVLFVLMSLGIAASGWLLLSPALSIVGAVLYGVLLFVGLLATLLLVVGLFTNPLMLPAVQAEGSDVLDAMQRAFAYLLGRPGRFLLYLLIAVLTGVVAVSIAGFILMQTLVLTESLATAWLSTDQHGELFGGDFDGASSSVIAFWEDVVHAIWNGYIVSYFFSVSTAMYLVLRRVNDDQDMSEIWMPGMIDGTMAAEDDAPRPEAATMSDGEG